MLTVFAEISEGAATVMRKVMNGLVVAILAVPALVIGQAGDDAQPAAERDSRSWGREQLRGRNLNAPINGVRPNGNFANILSLVNDAESTTDSINVGWNLTKLDWKQSFPRSTHWCNLP